MNLKRLHTNMNIIITLFALIAATTALQDAEKWQQFKTQHLKLYSNIKEETYRYGIFKENLQKIQEHNKKFENGETTFGMGINQFADMTAEEFKQYLGYQKRTKPVFSERPEHFVPEDSSVTPDFVNWTAKGAVTSVKNQGGCGSCWSFSAVGSLEGQYFKKTGQLIEFSAQNLVDCDKNCSACRGGLMDEAYKYIEKNGIYTEKDYPYRGINGACKANISTPFLKEIASYGYFLNKGEDLLKNLVANVGPICVSMDASIALQFYQNGIYTDRSCKNDEDNLNHAILAVGYGTENGKDYWILKNSWGPKWGENGYFRIARNVNLCGIAVEFVYPIL